MLRGQQRSELFVLLARQCLLHAAKQLHFGARSRNTLGHTHMRVLANLATLLRVHSLRPQATTSVHSLGQFGKGQFAASLQQQQRGGRVFFFTLYVLCFVLCGQWKREKWSSQVARPAHNRSIFGPKVKSERESW